MISVQEQDFDPAGEQQELEAQAGCGAVVTFTGLVRGSAGESLFLEHYPGMTEQTLAQLEDEALARWDLLAVRVIHRVGQLEAGARIVHVGVASAHRADAFAACEFLIDRLKTTAPFWKKEIGPDGEHWVEARESDDQRAARWE